MSDLPETATCQRCGVGYVLIPSYLGMLARRQPNMIVPVLCPTCFLTKGPLPKQNGSVKWFNPGKRYGFIVTEAGEEVFVHQDQVLGGKRDNLRDGQRVSFHVRYTAKGLEALNVELAEE